MHLKVSFACLFCLGLDVLNLHKTTELCGLSKQVVFYDR